MVSKTEATDLKQYERAALASAGMSVVGLGLGMVIGKAGVGAVLGAGAGLLWRAWLVGSPARSRRS